MHYIRFLKTPKCASEHGTLEVTTLITIASDLGESFFPDNVSIRAQAICGEQVCGSKNFSWTGAMRSLKVQMKLSQKPKTAFVLKLAALEINESTQSQGEDVILLPIVLDAWSGLIDPRGKVETEKMVERRFDFGQSKEMRIWEETGESLARHLWPGGVTLMKCIDRSTETSSGLPSLDAVLSQPRRHCLRVIELGAGCGLVGLALAKIIRGVDVLLTDLVEAEEITRRNISSAEIKKPSMAAFEVLDWTQPLPPSTLHTSFDLILIADCTYNADFIPALVTTLSALVRNSPEALVIVATKTRHSSEAVFFELMEKARFTTTDRTYALAPTRLPVEEPEDAERIDVYCFKYDPAERPKRGRKSSPRTGDGEESGPKRRAVSRNG